MDANYRLRMEQLACNTRFPDRPFGAIRRTGRGATRPPGRFVDGVFVPRWRLKES